jgi:hypothetical protein
MRRAGANVSEVRDDCGVSDNASAVLRYVGVVRQSVKVNIGTGGVCKTNDHNSVVSFGELPGGYTGKACV